MAKATKTVIPAVSSDNETTTVPSSTQDVATPTVDNVERQPTAKELQDFNRQQSEIRKVNKQRLEDFKMEVDHSILQAELVFQRFRTMRAFIDSENLVEEYLGAVEKKRVRSEEAAGQPALSDVRL